MSYRIDGLIENRSFNAEREDDIAAPAVVNNAEITHTLEILYFPLNRPSTLFGNCSLAS